MLTKQSMEGDKPLELGVVIHAVYIRQVIAQLDQAQPAGEPPAAQPAVAIRSH